GVGERGAREGVDDILRAYWGGARAPPSIGMVAANKRRRPADIVVRFDHEHGRPCINGRNGGRQPRGASANDHHIRLQVPACRQVASARFPYTRITDVDPAVTSTCCHARLSLRTDAVEEHPWNRSRVRAEINSKHGWENVQRQQGAFHPSWPNSRVQRCEYPLLRECADLLECLSLDQLGQDGSCRAADDTATPTNPHRRDRLIRTD